MPILKTQILGSIVEINYATNEKERLLYIIEKFNQRLKEFKNLEGQVSDKKICRILIRLFFTVFLLPFLFPFYFLFTPFLLPFYSLFNPFLLHV